MSAGVDCVPSLGHSGRKTDSTIGGFGIVLALAVALGIGDLKAQTATAPASTADPARGNATATAWCLQRLGTNDPPACSYETYPACLFAGLRDGGYCFTNPGPAAAATPPAGQARRRVARAPAPAAPQDAAASTQASQAPRKRKLTDAEREKLFKDFQQWRAERGEHAKR